MDIRRLVYFSLFLSVYSATSAILIGFSGAEDQVLGIIIALFFPFIGLKYYKYFLIYKGITFIIGFPSFMIAIESVTKTLLDFIPNNSMLIWYLNNNLLGTLILVIIVYVEAYIWLPYISYRILKKIGFYHRINSILGEKNGG